MFDSILIAPFCMFASELITPFNMFARELIFLVGFRFSSRETYI